jgi:hypothetical protein
MSKLINYVGYSRVNGELKFRTAATEARVFQLEKLGDTDVKMTTVAIETTSKSEAAKYCLTHPFFANESEEVIALFTANAKDDNPFKAKKVSKPRTVKVKKPRLILSPTVSVGADDAPYTPKQAAKIRAEFMKKLKSAYEAN